MPTFIFYPSGSVKFRSSYPSFNHIASGRLCLAGRAGERTAKSYRTKFKERDLAWVASAAARGVLDRVAIKRLEVVQNFWTPLRVLYVDTWNSYWLEDMLLTHDEAVAAAAAYYERYIADLEAEIRADNPSCPA